jgi:hypothetical protein
MRALYVAVLVTSLALSMGCLDSDQAIEMTPLIVSSYYYPNEPIVMEGSVSKPDGSPVKSAAVGAVILCVQSELGDEGCRKGDVLCEIDPQCGMCKCVRTDNWGVYKLSLQSPVEAGDYRMKVVVVDDKDTKTRITESSDFTVG